MRLNWFPMTTPPFEPSKAVSFDLDRGRITLDDPSLLLPAKALAIALAALPGEERSRLAQAIGDTMGQRVARRLSAAPQGTVSPEDLLDHLGGEVALAGLGSLSLERWGRALVLVLDHCPLLPEQNLFVAAILQGALSSATGRPSAVVTLAQDGPRARLLVASRSTADKAQELLKSGAPWSELLVRLHASSTSSQGVS